MTTMVAPLQKCKLIDENNWEIFQIFRPPAPLYSLMTMSLKKVQHKIRNQMENALLSPTNRKSAKIIKNVPFLTWKHLLWHHCNQPNNLSYSVLENCTNIPNRRESFSAIHCDDLSAIHHDDFLQSDNIPMLQLPTVGAFICGMQEFYCSTNLHHHLHVA